MKNTGQKCNVFVCYTEYTLFTAMILRKAYQIDDNCVLVLMGDMANQIKGNIENVRNNTNWDEIIIIDERDKSQSIHDVDNLVSSHNIGIIYIAHIAVLLTHYLTNILSDDVEINMYDEGVSSLEIEKVYLQLNQVGDISAEYPFRFDRVKNYYVLYPEVTSYNLIKNVKDIGLSSLSKQEIEQLLCECEAIFGYHFSDIHIKKVLFIDEPLASIGLMTENAEKHYISTIFRFIPAKEAIIKEKPSRGKVLISREERFPFDGISYFDEKNIPFEIIYLYLMLKGLTPKLVINNGSSLGYNIALINKAFNNKNCIVISTELIERKFIIDEIKDHSINVVNKMKKYFEENPFLQFPQTWEEFCNIVNRVNEGTTQCGIDYKDEYRWLINEYESLIDNEIVPDRIRGGFIGIAYDICGLHFQKRELADLFLDRCHKEIYIYGTGLISKLITNELNDGKIGIKGYIRTMAADGESFAGKEVYLPSTIPDPSLPIFIAVHNKDREIIELLHKQGIKSEILTISELFKNEKSLKFYISKLYE